MTDTSALEKLGVKPTAVANLVCKTIGTMIFSHGFVHCDPHPGNLLVRVDPQKPKS